MSIKNEYGNGLDLNLNMDDSEIGGMIEIDLESRIEKVCDYSIQNINILKGRSTIDPLQKHLSPEYIDTCTLCFNRVLLLLNHSLEKVI